MAEGWINHELGDTWLARSAGTDPAECVHPLAIRAMAEVGIDIRGGVPEHLDLYPDQPWDLVITVCDSAKERCPVIPGAVEQIHISFPDPADAEGSDDERITVFRSVRDAIREQLLPEVARRV
jgi:arsenate reductase